MASNARLMVRRWCGTVGASMGIAVGSATLSHPFDLLKQAEIALHRAKADPVRATILFDP